MRRSNKRTFRAKALHIWYRNSKKIVRYVRRHFRGITLVLGLLLMWVALEDIGRTRILLSQFGVNPEFSLSHEQSFGADKVEEIFTQYDSPLQGTGEIWVKYAKLHDIDVAYGLAIYMQEHSLRQPPNFNFGNITCVNNTSPCSGRFRVYASVEEGVDALFGNLAGYRDFLGISNMWAAVYTWAPPVENASFDYAYELHRLIITWRADR